MKSYTDIEQSKKLAEILPLESADMVLPFTHKENNKYVPGYAISRNYIEVHKEMSLLSAMDKSTICKLIQPCWSLAALLNILPKSLVYTPNPTLDAYCCKNIMHDLETYGNNPVDACYEMILKLYELNML